MAIEKLSPLDRLLEEWNKNPFHISGMLFLIYKEKRRIPRTSEYDETGTTRINYEAFGRIKQLLEPGRLEVLLDPGLSFEKKVRQLGLSKIAVRGMISRVKRLGIRSPGDADFKDLADTASSRKTRKELYENLLRQTILETGKSRNITLNFGR